MKLKGVFWCAISVQLAQVMIKAGQEEMFPLKRRLQAKAPNEYIYIYISKFPVVVAAPGAYSCMCIRGCSDC